MYCNKCGNQIEQNQKFCSKCGSEIELPQIDNKKLKLINIFRIFDILLYSGLFVYLMKAYIDLLFNQGNYAYANIIFVAPFVMVALLYVGLIILLNAIGGKNFVVGNIKATSIMQIIPSAIMTLGAFNMQFIYGAKSIFYIIVLIVAALSLIFSIYKLTLLKGVIRKSSKKRNTAFIIGYFFIVGLILISMIVIAFMTADCNKHYKLDEKQLKEQLKQYTYVAEEEVEHTATGFECRNKDIETYIYFYDKYNNKINLTISDLDEGRLDISEAQHVVDKIQFVNNVLKNQKLKLVYEDEGYHYYDTDIEFDDDVLENAFNSSFGIYQHKSDNILLHSYDINDTNYLLNISLYDKIGTIYDKEEVMQHLDSFVSFLCETIGSEHINKIEVRIGNENLKFKEYSLNEVIWENEN